MNRLSPPPADAPEAGPAHLKALEDRLRAILNHAADAIIVIDEFGRIEGANPAAERLSDWGEPDLLGLPVSVLMRPGDGAVHQSHIDHYLATGLSGILGVGPRPLILRRRDGLDVPIELSVGQAMIGGARRFIGVCRDISLRLDNERALAEANARLALQVEEMRRLAEEASQARAAAEAASQAKSTFVATMSHELRTPLNGILAVAEALSRRDLAEADREMARIILASGQGLRSILNEVLDLAKVEAGAMTLEPHPFAPAEVVAEVADIWRFAAQAKGLALTVQADALPAQLVGDAGRLRQVLSNLVNNAVKFTEKGGVILRAMPFGPPGTLRFEVIDTGPGMAADQRERLFEPFVQAEQGSTRRHGGTGLGLAICRRIAELMRGRVWAEAGPGGGTRMVCELAFGQPEAARGQAPGPVQPPAREAPARGPRILVAEDHALNRRVAGILLDEAGFEHEFAEDGEAAVAAVATGRFDLVLMDVHMPRMDGLEAARRIRALPGPAGRLPIIAVTASDAAEEIAACRQAGMDDLVAKPISAPRLLRRIAHHLGAA